MDEVQGKGKKRVTEVVTEENFSKFVEAYELAEQGNIEEANVIRSEIGLNNGNGARDGSGKGRGTRGGNGDCMNR